MKETTTTPIKKPKNTVTTIKNYLLTQIKSIDLYEIKEFTIGLLIGVFFSIYGFYIINLFSKKSKQKSKGIYYGVILSIFFITIFCCCFLFYCNYVIDVKGRNHEILRKTKKGKVKIFKILRFTDFLGNRFKRIFKKKRNNVVVKKKFVKKRKVKKTIV